MWENRGKGREQASRETAGRASRATLGIILASCEDMLVLPLRPSGLAVLPIHLAAARTFMGTLLTLTYP